MNLPILQGQMLMDFLKIERVGFADVRRRGYENLYDIWHQKTFGKKPPYMYGKDGEWKETAESARMAALAHIHMGTFDGDTLADYKRELGSAATDKRLSHDDFVVEMAKLNQRFAPYIEGHNHTTHVLLVNGHNACHHDGRLTCPGCDAAIASLHVAENGASLHDTLTGLDEVERVQFLDEIGLHRSIKEFQAASATWMRQRADGRFEIFLPAHVA